MDRVACWAAVPGIAEESDKTEHVDRGGYSYAGCRSQVRTGTLHYEAGRTMSSALQKSIKLGIGRRQTQLSD